MQSITGIKTLHAANVWNFFVISAEGYGFAIIAKKNIVMTVRDPVEHCDDCGTDFCPDCRYLALKKDWKSACSGCFQIISGIIGQKIQDEKQEEHEKLLRENEILRREIKQMREKKK